MQLFRHAQCPAKGTGSRGKGGGSEHSRIKNRKPFCFSDMLPFLVKSAHLKPPTGNTSKTHDTVCASWFSVFHDCILSITACLTVSMAGVLRENSVQVVFFSHSVLSPPPHLLRALPKRFVLFSNPQITRASSVWELADTETPECFVDYSNGLACTPARWKTA